MQTLSRENPNYNYVAFLEYLVLFWAIITYPHHLPSVNGKLPSSTIFYLKIRAIITVAGGTVKYFYNSSGGALNPLSKVVIFLSC